MRAKVVIVGGGVMGTSIAMHLAPRLDPLTEPVVLLERSSELGAGSSGRSGAILRQFYADLPVARMARDSLGAYARFAGRTGRDVGFRRTGVLTLAGPGAPEWVERLRATAAALAEAGIGVRLVDADEMRRLVHGIEVEDGAVGAFEEEAGFVDPALTLEAFAGLARSHGAVTRLGVEVTAIRVEGGRAVGVETSEGPVDADAVVVCAGPWARALLARAGVELPLRAVRPEQHFLTMPGAAPSRRGPSTGAAALAASAAGRPLEPVERLELDAVRRAEREPDVAHPSVIDLEAGFYTRCEPARGRTRVGRTDYVHDEVLDDPDRLDESVSESFRAWAREVLVKRLPVYADHEDADAQAAWYTLTPDSQAVLGPLAAVESLFVATGFSGHGFKLAPSVGEGVAQLVLGDAVTSFDRSFFAPDRFAGRAADFGEGAFGL